MDLLEKIALMIVAAILTFVAAAFWFRKNRVVKKEDEEDSESKVERQKLAAKLEETRQGRADKLEEQAEKTQLKLASIDAEIATLKAHAAPINAAFTALLVKELTHMHTPVMDGLMQKLNLEKPAPPDLTDAEERELITALEQRTKDMGQEISDNERDAAEIFPAMIRRVKREASAVEEGAEFTTVQVVGILHENEKAK